MGKRKADEKAPHTFGGPWTQQKLALLSKYLSAYTRILSKKRFRYAYIDAFAGSGSRSASSEDGQADLFIDAEEFADGSARIALACEPPFQKFIFIDSDKTKLDLLAEAVLRDFPGRAACVTYRHGDANAELRKLCSRDWSAHRALLFLDPYGMQVEWETVVAIAATKSIDLWVLFPSGIAVNRMLPRRGDIQPAWRARLNQLFGTEAWEAEFYGADRRRQLFDDQERREKVATLDSIVSYYQSRLQSIFAGVADSPAVLRNSKGYPMYALCFAVANANGAKPALKIANGILRKYRDG